MFDMNVFALLGAFITLVGCCVTLSKYLCDRRDSCNESLKVLQNLKARVKELDFFICSGCSSNDKAYFEHFTSNWSNKMHEAANCGKAVDVKLQVWSLIQEANSCLKQLGCVLFTKAGEAETELVTDLIKDLRLSEANLLKRIEAKEAKLTEELQMLFSKQALLKVFV